MLMQHWSGATKSRKIHKDNVRIPQIAKRIRKSRYPVIIIDMISVQMDVK
jgi:hypothetical protein